MIAESTYENGWEAQWPDGYEENFVVFEPQMGLSEESISKDALDPYTDFKGTALEVGCGGCFWSKKHLLPRFSHVIGVDVIRTEWVYKKLDDPRFKYVRVPSGDYTLGPIADNSIDFVWSFGCLVHLQRQPIFQYLKSIHRVLKPGCHAVIEAYDSIRRPEVCGDGTNIEPGWSDTSIDDIKSGIESAGFEGFRDLFPKTKALLVTTMKPQL
jgi:SAM-dependent methyltransferase